MTQYWEPGTEYRSGDIVQYEGHRYKVIQPHRSQSDWAPSIATASLWGRMSDEDHSGEQQHGYNPQYSDEKKHEKHEQAQQHEQRKEEEKKKHWYDIDDERKKQIEIGGGLALGAALLGGGYLAYKEHGKHEEEKKAQTWALQNWVKDAQARTLQYHQQGGRSPATWILNEGKNIPRDAIVVGKEHDWTLYIARAFYEGSLQIGKASEAFQKGAVIGYAHEEIQIGTYEILVGDMNGLEWVSARGHLNVNALGRTPVEGGRDSDGSILYIAEALYNDVVHPGKASEKLDGAFIPYDGTEKNVKEYRVLCYKK